MKNHLSGTIDYILTLVLLVVAGLTPILFLNQTTEFYEMPKLVFLVVSTVLLLGLWIFSWILKGKIVITRTPLDIPLLLLAGAIIASTYFSETRFTSIYGNLPRVHGSAASWITYILLYFVTVSHLSSAKKLKPFLYVLFGSGVVVSLFTILSFFGIFLPIDFARSTNFTPTGSTFSTIAFLLLLLPLPLFSIIHPNKNFPAPFAIALTILFGVTVVLIGTIPSYIALVVAIALCFFVSKPYQIKKALPTFLLPIAVIGFVMALVYLPLPGNANPLRTLQVNYPKEIQLPFPISWKISASAFRDAPFFGTGPGTYLFNFTTYKPVEFNQERFWSFSFDTAHNEYLQTLGTLGIFGLLSLLFVSFVVFNNSRKSLAVHTSEVHEDSVFALLPAFAISGMVSILLMAIHTTTLVSPITTLFIFAAIMVSQRQIREKVMELSLGIKASTADNRHFDLLPAIIFVVFLIAAVPVLYKTYTATTADYYHRLALSQANKSGSLTYQYLQKAESLNPQVDLYRIDMAQTNFALANAIATNASQKQVAEGESALSEKDRQTIQTLLSQAINEGRASVTLSPRSSRNWTVLASIYRNISGVSQNALAFSLDSYGKAIQRDPLNPALRVNVGGIYYAAQNYDLAIRFFTDAANLKPDYANAYYNLAIALRDKNDLKNAQSVAEQAVALLKKDTNSPDYKTAADLLSDIKAKVPASETNSALGNENVSNVNVNDLNNPPQEVATPAAVKSNPNARVPQISPSPTAAPARSIPGR